MAAFLPQSWNSERGLGYQRGGNFWRNINLLISWEQSRFPGIIEPTEVAKPNVYFHSEM